MKNLNLYETCRNMPNPSNGLLSLFKKKPSERIWAMLPAYNDKEFVPLYKLKSLQFHQVILKIGSPDFDHAVSINKNKTCLRGRVFSGRNILQNMFSGRRSEDTWMVGIGTKSRGTWMIDVTEQVLKKLNEVGSCAISPAHCNFKLISPKVKECEYCKRKLRKTTRIIKSAVWK